VGYAECGQAVALVSVSTPHGPAYSITVIGVHVSRRYQLWAPATSNL